MRAVDGVRHQRRGARSTKKPVILNDPACMRVLNEIDALGLKTNTVDPTVGRQLKKDADWATEALSRRGLDNRSLIILHNARITARYYISSFNHNRGQAYDLSEAQDVVAEIDQLVVLMDQDGAANWTIIKSNALYFAALIERNALSNFPAAYRYFESCADLGHAGCVNNMAVAYMTGEDAHEIDLNKALEYHKRVSTSATEYGCAAVYSTMSIVMLMELDGVKSPGERADDWLSTAYHFLDELDEKYPRLNRCGREFVLFDDYLIHLRRGEARPTLLDDVGRVSDASYVRVIVEFLRGTMSNDDYRTKISADNVSPTLKCRLVFYGLWSAEIAGSVERSRPYFDLLRQNNSLNCKLFSVYAKNFSTIQ
jgi:hypothetical protein